MVPIEAAQTRQLLALQKRHTFDELTLLEGFLRVPYLTVRMLEVYPTVDAYELVIIAMRMRNELRGRHIECRCDCAATRQRSRMIPKRPAASLRTSISTLAGFRFENLLQELLPLIEALSYGLALTRIHCSPEHPHTQMALRRLMNCHPISIDGDIGYLLGDRLIVP